MKKIFFIVLIFVVICGIGFFVWNQKNSSSSDGQTPINVENLNGEYEVSALQGLFHNDVFPVPENDDKVQLQQAVLGANNDNKRIEVDLTNQRLYAFEGDRKVFDFQVSTGKWNKTPTGTFRIWIKLKYTRMTGGNKKNGTFYDLPNVPYTMYFYNDLHPKYEGYGVHGAYWHNNFGHPMSHGCINMRTAEVKQLYYWANPDLRGKSSILATNDNLGTPIIIYGETPKN